ncbi:hypothetical protein [Stakelama marina]|uniref:Uncharacterized protein n=1 Tax=Stakelama marina TaxID=2826939 RepID=A0A8T4IMI3_9SPHN|nr:hypothetical protein [Stakelama marina]MBR0553356.1 hypothetical protein [Stakelama marina]
MRVVPALLVALALAGCGGDEAAPQNRSPASNRADAAAPSTEPPVANTPGALPAPEFAGADMAKGSWTSKTLAGGSAALFGPSESEARFIIRCDPDSHQIVFIRSGAMPVQDAMMHIATDTGATAFPAHAADTQAPEVRAESSPTLPFVGETLAANPARIAVKLGDDPALVMPGDPAIGRVIHGCRG